MAKPDYEIKLEEREAERQLRIHAPVHRKIRVPQRHMEWHEEALQVQAI